MSLGVWGQCLTSLGKCPSFFRSTFPSSVNHACAPIRPPGPLRQGLWLNELEYRGDLKRIGGGKEGREEGRTGGRKGGKEGGGLFL